jgi:hypothetical protein
MSPGQPGQPSVAHLLPPPEVALARSRPRPPFPVAPLLMICLAIGLGGLLLSGTGDPASGSIVRTAVVFIPLIVLLALSFWGGTMARRFRDENTFVTRVEDSARLDHYDSAVPGLVPLLGAAMLSPLHRLRALFVYVMALLRCGRYEEATRAIDQLLEEGVTSGMVPPLKAARAYSLLREDRLHDADRALTELKRLGRDGNFSALAAVAEAYRDVRTGNSDAILEHHAQRCDNVRRQVGRRLADLEAMAAWAHLRKSDLPAAQFHWSRATLLDSPRELVDRYPELNAVAAACPARPVPPETLEVPPQHWRPA